MAKIILLAIILSPLLGCASSESPLPVKNLKNTSTINFHHQFLKYVNLARSKGRQCGEEFFPAALPLTLDNRLNQAAHMHSLDMYTHQYLEHVSSNGDTLVERMQKVEFEWRAIAENIAHNQKSIGQVIEDWLSSPGHCSNMMSSAYTMTGVANVNRYWTQVFAAPK